jgi:DNA polymerase-3 subunit alpha
VDLLKNKKEKIQMNEENNLTKKEKSTDYGKLSKAIGDITARGLRVSLIDINKSNFSFEPDEENNEILFGLKGVNKIGDDVVESIIANRPYKGIVDFMQRCPLNKTQMISLIKAGAFDKTDKEWASKIDKDFPRYAIMAYYIYLNNAKKQLTLQNFNSLLENNIIPQELQPQRMAFIFNKFLKDNKKVGKYFIFDEGSLSFYSQNYNTELLEVINGIPCILQKNWDKIYQKEMDPAREWLKDNQDQVLTKYNSLLFYKAWEKDCQGNVSAWEMESLCFYYHEHELAHINKRKYGIENFFDLSEVPDVDYYFRRGRRDIPIFKLHRIAGTVITKNDPKSIVTILTTEGVVNVKFSKEYYAMFNRQISETLPNGKKKVLEKGWFSRGSKIMVTGFRREDTFVAKKYKSTLTHQLYKIMKVEKDGSLVLEHNRAGEEDGED